MNTKTNDKSDNAYVSQDFERTEELMAIARRKGKKNTIVIIAMALVLLITCVAGVILVKHHNGKELSEQLRIAETALAEGKYEEAIEAYDEVLKIDDRHADAYEGKGDAYVGLEKPAKAVREFIHAIDNGNDSEETYDKVIENAEKAGDEKTAKKYSDVKIKIYPDAKPKTKGAGEEYPNMGSTPEDIAAGGIVCQHGDDLYVANMPDDDSEGGRGCITRIDKNGKKKTLFKYKDITKTGYICELNVWDDYIYYVVRDPVKWRVTKSELRRVKIDGSSDEQIMQKGEGDDHRTIQNVAVIDNKIYFVAYYYSSSEVSELVKCDLDGGNVETINKRDNIYDFTTNGEEIFYSVYDEGEEKSYIVQYSVKDGNTTVFYDSEEQDMYPKVFHDGKIYASSFENLYALNPRPDEIDGVDVANCTVRFGKDEIYQKYNYDTTGTMMALLNEGEETFNVRDISGNQKSDFSISFTKEEMGMQDITPADFDKDTISLGITSYCIADGRIYYQFNRSRFVDSQENTIGCFFGNAALDGSDNQTYGYD